MEVEVDNEQEKTTMRQHPAFQQGSARSEGSTMKRTGNQSLSKKLQDEVKPRLIYRKQHLLCCLSVSVVWLLVEDGAGWKERLHFGSQH